MMTCLAAGVLRLEPTLAVGLTMGQLADTRYPSSSVGVVLTLLSGSSRMRKLNPRPGQASGLEVTSAVP